MLKFENVTKSFKDGNRNIEAVKDTNFEINKGDIIALVGPSGSGKSTFLTMAGALQTPTSGHILINNQDITTMKQKALAKVRMSEIGFNFTSYKPCTIFNGKATIYIIEKEK